MYRRPSTLLLVTAAAVAVMTVAAGCEAKVYGTPPAPSSPPLTVVAPLGSMAPLPEAPPDEPAVAFTGLDARERQASADASKSGADLTVAVLDRNTGQLVTNGGRHHRHRLGGQALHRRRPAAAGVQGPDAALPRRPCGVRPDASVVGRQRGGDVLEPQRRQRDHQPGGRSLRIDVDPRAEQRAVVQHHQHGHRPGPLLRHDAGGQRRVAARAGQPDPVQPCGVHADCARRDGARRRLPAAVRHPGRPLRRTRRGQAGLDVLRRLRLAAPVHRRDRAGSPLCDGDQLDAGHGRRPTLARPSPRP